MFGKNPVVVIGGGLAGLACARALESQGIGPILLLEASDRVGGRVKTDELDGFLLDHGFQVYLTDYEEAGRWLDLDALDMHAFDPAARLRIGGKWSVVRDPFRAESLTDLADAARAPIGSLADKARVAGLRLRLAAEDRRAPGAEEMRAESRSTLEFLRGEGFSETMIDRFFRAFYGGIFLERGLDTNSALFRFTYGAFARGHAALPGQGMEAIPRQLANGLRRTEIRCGTRVVEVGPDGVRLAEGTWIPASAVVVAAEAAAAARLLPGLRDPGWKATTCLYFAAPETPYVEPVIALGTEPGDLIRNLAVLSRVAPGYASGAEDLVSVTVLGAYDPEEIRRRVVARLAGWFPHANPARWRFLRGYRIDRALPVQRAGDPPALPQLPKGIFLAGDHGIHGSIEGAIRSGVDAAGQAVAHLRAGIRADF